MQILFLNPFHGGSHAVVAEGYAAHSTHTVDLLTLPVIGGWRWRMRGAAITMTRMVRARALRPDLLLTTDMLDVTTFRALTRDVLPPTLPMVLYMHENQLTYPLPDQRARDLSFAWVNYTSALAANAILFNSEFHRRTFLAALPDLPGRYFDHQELDMIEQIATRSQVLSPGIDLARHQAYAPAPRTDDPNRPAVILWNSRWDYDKQPEQLFEALEVLAVRGIDFRLIMAGDCVDPGAERFMLARERWAPYLLHWGYASDFATYSRLLHQADIVVSTALQEFFGIGIIEALYCGCIPILPRRLTYPDLLPATYHADCLYNSLEELVDRLQHAIDHRHRLRRLPWRNVAAPYDWATMAPRYDAVLAEVAAQNRRETEGRDS
ncbi:MAG: DUF3524 domain-containing protein [Chloroflexaceae bacterium]|nr:DUF3524 domain-containing protein [Chloroflexaceae bacterium]